MKFFYFVIIFLMCLKLIDLTEEFSKKKMAAEVLRQPPTERMVELAVMEFKNLASDIIFFDSITFVGGKSSSQWASREKEWLYSMLLLSSALNPYNQDVYFLAQSILTWEAHMYDEVNRLLERAVQYRDRDWRYPFFIGFNYFYFLNEYGKGAEYLQQAIDKPAAPKPALTTLASRLYYRAGRTEIGLLLLKDAVKQTTDKNIRRIYENRIKALEGILSIETAILQYESKFHKKPNSLNVLLHSGLLKTVPTDPYGGQYYIDNDGRVKITSDFKM